MDNHGNPNRRRRDRLASLNIFRDDEINDNGPADFLTSDPKLRRRRLSDDGISDSFASFHTTEEQFQPKDLDEEEEAHQKLEQSKIAAAEIASGANFICGQCILDKTQHDESTESDDGQSVNRSNTGLPSSRSDSNVGTISNPLWTITKHSVCEHKSKRLYALRNELLDAIKEGNTHKVVRIVSKRNLDLNFDMNRTNPISRATSLCHLDIMKVLLEAGAIPGIKNRSDLLWERHPIHISASNGHLGAMQLLVTYGADINQKDNDRRTPLHWVAMYGHAHMVKWMLGAGARVNATQTDGFTPLHTTTCLGHKEVCRLLIEGGANMSYRDSDGWTPLHTSVCYGYIDIVQLLIANGASPLNRTMIDQDTTLHLACSKGRLDMVEVRRKFYTQDNMRDMFSQLMIDEGVPLESRNSYGFTPLLTSVFYNRTEITRNLLRRGANVNAINNSGTSSIYLSGVRCEEELIRLLLLAGCRVQKFLSLPVAQHCPPLAAELDYHSKVPQPLMEKCMVLIRQKLAPHLQTNVQLLPLPSAIKREIALEDLSAVVASQMSESRS